MRIIGIDPGSIKTGYGVIDTDGSKTSYVASGVIDTKKNSFNERLKVIFESLSSNFPLLNSPMAAMGQAADLITDRRARPRSS